MLGEAEYAVFFGGAGVSTDSGIPDFRGLGGLYGEGEEDSGEYLMSLSCLHSEPERFFSFYRNNMYHPFAEPCDAHLALAALEQDGRIRSVITQNIDGFHQKAGSRRVIELHGCGSRYYCAKCGRSAVDVDMMGVPRCKKCDGLLRPDVVLYGESPNGEVLSEAEEEIAMADVLIVGGTSLAVNPAASLVAEFMGEHLIIINQSPTTYDGLAEIVIRDSISDVLQALL